MATNKPQEIKFDVKTTVFNEQEQNKMDTERKFFETYKLKNYVTSAPTYIPKNFYESIVYYDDGVNRRVYFYVNNTWRLIALT